MIIFNEGITLLSKSLNLFNPDLVNIQVTGCWYWQTLVRVDISRPFVSLSLFGGGGGVQKVFYFPCFGITKHHLIIKALLFSSKRFKFEVSIIISS